MPIPPFLAPAPLTLTGPTLLAAIAAGGSSARSHRVGFVIERQEQDNWCWAATSVSVERFYDPVSSRTQCDLANAALGRQDCCGPGASDPAACDRPWYLDRALAITGNLNRFDVGLLSFSEVQSELNADSPIGCRIGWLGGGGHFVAVVGWLVAPSGTRYVDVADPIWLESQVAFDDFPSGYQTGGDWTHTYRTGPATAGGTLTLAASSDPDSIGA